LSPHTTGNSCSLDSTCPKELEDLLGLNIRIPAKSTATPAPDREVAFNKGYARKCDVSLPAKVKGPIVLNSNTRTAIRGLADEKQDGLLACKMWIEARRTKVRPKLRFR
jgi:hypothetical protein